MADSVGLSTNDSREMATLVTLGALVRLPLFAVMMTSSEAARQSDDYLLLGSQWLMTGRYGLVGAPAKASLDGTDRVTALQEWENEVPLSELSNPFQHSSALSEIAKRWIDRHSAALLNAMARGTFNLFFGSDWSVTGPRLFGPLWAPVRVPVLSVLLLWRIVTLFVAAMAIPLSLLRCRRGI